jgi:hypothetical protein
MKALVHQLLHSLTDSVRDLLPIIAVIAFFQLLVLGQPIPNLLSILWGVLLVVSGLTLFVQGLKLGLFPIGESMAWDFAAKGSLPWLLLFAFALGFGTTVAEPALIAVAEEAAEVAARGRMIADHDQAREDYAEGLRYTVALSVGLAIVIGVIRILRGWPIQYLIIGGYVGVVIMTIFAPREIIGIAYDSGGVTTSTITVPLVTALGVGLASSIEGRNPMIDGFGLIAFASLTPMIFVMGYGIMVTGTEPALAAAEPAVSGGTGVPAVVADVAASLGDILGAMCFFESQVPLCATIDDVLPIIAILVGFQVLVLRRRIPKLNRVLLGFLLVLLGLAFFLGGLEQALFPLGKLMAEQLTAPDFLGFSAAETGAGQPWQAFVWVYLFAFAIGFSTTIAEPSLIAVAIKANQVSAGAIRPWGLRVAVAIGVAVGIALGAFRIVTGTPLYWYIVSGYVLVLIQTWFAPRSIIALAYDSGGVTTSTVTVPLVAALGLGLSSNIPGRNPLLDGFGLIAFASLFPMMTVMGYAQLSEWATRRRGADNAGSLQSRPQSGT